MKNIFSTSLIALSLLLVSVNSNATEISASKVTQKKETAYIEISNESTKFKAIHCLLSSGSNEPGSYQREAIGKKIIPFYIDFIYLKEEPYLNFNCYFSSDGNSVIINDPHVIGLKNFLIKRNLRYFFVVKDDGVYVEVYNNKTDEKITSLKEVMSFIENEITLSTAIKAKL